MTRASDVAAPAIGVSVVECRPLGEKGRWRIVWRVENRGPVEIAILESWLPHGQFKAERLPLSPPLSLAAGGSVLIEREVEVRFPETGRVENAFLILRLGEGESIWRAFVRIRAESTEDGGLRPVIEAISTNLVEPEMARSAQELRCR